MLPGHRGPELHHPKSCSWEMAEVGFELRAPESGTAGGTVGPGSGRCCPDLPVTPDTTSPFCPVHSAHRKPGGGPPLPILSAAGGHGVLASPATTPGLPLPVLCKTRRPLRGMGRRLWWMSGRVKRGLSGGVTTRSYRSQAWPRPRPLPLPLLLQSAGSHKQEAGGPRKLGRSLSQHLVPAGGWPGLWPLWKGP